MDKHSKATTRTIRECAYMHMRSRKLVKKSAAYHKGVKKDEGTGIFSGGSGTQSSRSEEKEEGKEEVVVKVENEEDYSSVIEDGGEEWGSGIPCLLEGSINSDSGNHCLLCYQKVSRNMAAATSENLTEANFQAMFILRKMLQVPEERLQSYLKRFGSAYEWTVVCRSCRTLFDQALEIQRRISDMEKKLREVQMKMRFEIDSSWSETDILNDDPANEIRGLIKSSSLASLKEEEYVTASADNFEDSERLSIPSPILESPEDSPRPRRKTPYFDVANVCDAILSDDHNNQINSDNSCSSDWRPSPPKKQRKQSRKTTLSRKRNSTLKKSFGNESASHSGKDSEGVLSPISEPSHFSPLKTPEPEVDDTIPKAVDSDNSLSSEWCPSPPPSEKQRRANRKRVIRRVQKSVKKQLFSLKNGSYTCSSCPGLEGMSLANFISHGMFHYRRPFKCTECGIYFSSISELTKNSFAEKSGSHVCSEDSLVKITFNPGDIWECSNSTCSKKFSSDDARDSHEMTCCLSSTRITPSQTCLICAKKYRNLSERLLHRMVDHPEVAYMSCFFCYQTFPMKTKESIEIPDIQAINAHIRETHNHSSYPFQKLTDDCDFCGAIFHGSADLQKHMEVVHALNKEISYSCRICHSRKIDKKRITAHERHVHTDRIRKKLTYICDLCGFSAKERKKRFLEHQFTKHGIEPEDPKLIITCTVEECNFRTLVPTTLKRHMINEHGEKSEHICHTCGKGFHSEYYLKQHEEIHSNARPRPFQCELCGNTFARKDCLYIHKRLSHEKRPFASTSTYKPKTSRRRGINKRKMKKMERMNKMMSAAVNPVTAEPSAPAANEEIGKIEVCEGEQGIANLDSIFHNNY